MVKFGVEVVLQRVQLTEIRDEPRVVEYNAIFDHLLACARPSSTRANEEPAFTQT